MKKKKYQIELRNFVRNFKIKYVGSQIVAQTQVENDMGPINPIQ